MTSLDVDFQRKFNGPTNLARGRDVRWLLEKLIAFAVAGLGRGLDPTTMIFFYLNCEWFGCRWHRKFNVARPTHMEWRDVTARIEKDRSMWSWSLKKRTTSSKDNIGSLSYYF